MYPDAVDRYKTHPHRCTVRIAGGDFTIAEAIARGLLVRVSEGVYRRAA